MKRNNIFYISIYIPSYNRLESLRSTLIELVSQCAAFPDVQIIVQDNHSDIDYSNILLADLRKVPKYQCKVKINRNQSNVGMSANILRGFELADAEWLWLLSDDDRLDLKAVRNVREAADRAPKDVDFVRFSSHRSNVSKPTLIDSFDKFVENSESVDDFNSYIFISNGIYRLSSFKKELGCGYINCHTYVPHYMMLSNYMLNGGLSMISPQRVVNYEVPAIGYNYAMVAGLGVGSPKHTLLNVDRKTVKAFHSIFYPHNDLKVLVDLFFQTKFLRSKSEFYYLGTTYINYLGISRSWPWRFFLRSLVCFRFIPYGFEAMVAVMELCSSAAKRHIREMRIRYG